MLFSSKSKFLGSKQTIISGTIWITIFAFGSKLLGFIRQIIVSALFGTTKEFDAVIIAQQPAGFIASIIASSLGIVAIPIYLDLKLNSGSESARRFSRSLLGFIGILLVLLGINLFLFPMTFIKIFAPGFSVSTSILASGYLKIFSIFPVFTGLTVVFGAFLKAERMFFQYAFSSFVFNFFAIPILWLLAPKIGAGSYAVAFTIGNFFVAFLSYLFGIKIWRIFPFSNPFTYQTLKTLFIALPLLLSIMVGTINTIVDKAFASKLPAGSISALTYSFTIVSMISGLVTAGLLSSSFVSISESASLMDDRLIGEKMSKISELIIKVLAPIVGFIIIESHRIVFLVYQRGHFTNTSTENTALALIAYAPMILTIPINDLLKNFYIAKKHTLRMTFISIPFILLNAGLDWWLMGRFRHTGIAASSSIVGISRVMVLAIDIKSHYKMHGLFNTKRMLFPVMLSTIYVLFFLFSASIFQKEVRIIVEIFITVTMILLFTKSEMKLIFKGVRK